MKNKVIFETSAYAKILLHAAKYAHAAVNGVLLAKCRDGAKNQELFIVESIPLFHHSHNLAPMAEIALTQIEALAQANNCVIAGYYAACENFRDSTVDKCPSQKIAEKIVEYFPSAIFVVVDNKKVMQRLSSSPLILHKYIDGKWKPIESDGPTHECNSPNYLKTVSYFITVGIFRDIVDFDNYLDDHSLDWSNIGIKNLIALALAGQG